MNKITSQQWIEAIWDCSIYWPDENMDVNPNWVDRANKFLDIQSENDIIDYKDSEFGTAFVAFCYREENYIPKNPKSCYE